MILAMSLQGKVAVVTGASRGIGQATAIELARRGADVVVAARTMDEHGPLPGTVAETVAAVEALGVSGFGVRCNVGKQEDLEHLVQQTVERFGRIDVLVNNAAFTGLAASKRTLDLSRKEWELMFAVNIHAPFMLTKGFIEHFPSTGGVVVNVTSSAATHRPVTGDTGAWSPAYGATKAAMNRLGNFWASELLERRIAVITVDPGLVFSATMQALAEPGAGPADWQVTTDVPAKAIAYLAGLDDPMHRTGDVLDGPELVRRLGL
jgi:NAD(P)-dependent dehydrogenase (short-subunit alcohol dehydrogenase family)